MRDFLLDDFSVFALKRDKIIIAAENPGGGRGARIGGNHSPSE